MRGVNLNPLALLGASFIFCVTCMLMHTSTFPHVILISSHFSRHSSVFWSKKKWASYRSKMPCCKLPVEKKSTGWPAARVKPEPVSDNLTGIKCCQRPRGAHKRTLCSRWHDLPANTDCNLAEEPVTLFCETEVCFIFSPYLYGYVLRQQ